jgi:hypothetical protein
MGYSPLGFCQDTKQAKLINLDWHPAQKSQAFGLGFLLAFGWLEIWPWPFF